MKDRLQFSIGVSVVIGSTPTIEEYWGDASSDKKAFCDIRLYVIITKSNLIIDPIASLLSTGRKNYKCRILLYTTHSTAVC